MSENNIVGDKMSKDLRKSQCVIANILSIKDRIIVSHLLYAFQSKNVFGLSRKFKMCVCLHVCHMCRIVFLFSGGWEELMIQGMCKKALVGIKLSLFQK